MYVYILSFFKSILSLIPSIFRGPKSGVPVICECLEFTVDWSDYLISLLLFSKNRDVVIKPVSHGENKTNELRILEYLNSETLRADKTNATVPVIEFIEHSGWTFSVSQRWHWSTEPEFFDIGEVLDWSLQLIAVSLSSTFLQFLMMYSYSLQAVAFLHRNLIAHLVNISSLSFLQ